MYEEFYSMDRTPFLRDIPAEDIYKNEIVNDAINRLSYACRHKQFAMLIGPHGSGKTTLLRYLKYKLNPADYVFVYICEHDLEPRLFYNLILLELGYTHSMQFANARTSLLRELEKLQGKKIVAVVDNAETVTNVMLDEIRFMLNYKMDTENPFAFILSGTNEILRKLKNESYRATLNRVEMECNTAMLTMDQTAEYIKHQLEYSGCNEPLFPKDVTDKIYRRTKGSPMMINKLCTFSLQLASQTSSATVTSEILEAVIKEEFTLFDNN